MSVEPHPLITEFPEYAEKMHALKVENAHYRKLVHEYEGLDISIVRAENQIEIINDDHLEQLKKERLFLKDMIFAMLK